MALRVIAAQQFAYYKFICNDLNAIGLNVPNYDIPLQLRGSVQPVARSMYEQLGLDLDKTYLNVWTSNTLVDIDRDRSSDQIVFNGQRYQATSNTPWFPIDGWTAAIFVKVPNAG